MLRARVPTRGFAASRRGAAAVEFALVANALMMLVAAMVHIGFCLYAQSILDQAALNLATQFQTGQNSNTTDPNNAVFKSNTVCPALMGLLDCAAVKVVNYPVTDYLSGGGTTFNPGGSKSTMLLQLVYTVPIPTWPVLAGQGSPSPLLITASVPYVNEF